MAAAKPSTSHVRSGDERHALTARVNAAASRGETREWLPPSGAAGSVRIARAFLNEMQFSGFDVVQIRRHLQCLGVPRELRTLRTSRCSDCVKFSNADVVGIPQVGDVLSEFLLEGLDKALRREVRSATVRVVNDRNIVDVEEIARNADRSLRAAGCAAAGNHHRKVGGVRTYVLFAVLA